MRNDDNAAMAAVEVIKSFRTSLTQVAYAASFTHRSFVAHSQVPPESDRMEAFTEIWKGQWKISLATAEVTSLEKHTM